MGLYEQLAAVYDRLFPVNPATLAWIAALPTPPLAGSARRRVLDLGSATGGHALALAAAGWEALGLEPCAPMVSRARELASAAGLSARFALAGMEDVEALTGPDSVDLCLCLGNTLPHLAGNDALASFLASLRRTLRPGGLFLLQMLNYGPILAAGGMGGFPPILEGELRFERRYEPSSGGKLRFITRLESGNRVFEDETLLEPFTPARLRDALAAAGFGQPRSVATWQGEAFDESRSPFLIMDAASGPRLADRD